MTDLNPQPLPPRFLFRPRPIGDPIDMEFVLDAVDPAARSQLVAMHLQTAAKAQAAIAEGMQQMADHVSANPNLAQGGGGQ